MMRWRSTRVVSGRLSLSCSAVIFATGMYGATRATRGTRVQMRLRLAVQMARLAPRVVLGPAHPPRLLSLQGWPAGLPAVPAS